MCIYIYIYIPIHIYIYIYIYTYIHIRNRAGLGGRPPSAWGWRRAIGLLPGQRIIPVLLSSSSSRSDIAQPHSPPSVGDSRERKEMRARRGVAEQLVLVVVLGD